MRVSRACKEGEPLASRGRHARRLRSGCTRKVPLFHGEEWHGGWPEGHKRCGGINQHGMPYGVLYQMTLEAHELYKKQGFRVFVVWELEYKTTTRAHAPAHIKDVVREV